MKPTEFEQHVSREQNEVVGDHEGWRHTLVMLLQQVGAFSRGPYPFQKGCGNFPFLGPLPVVAHSYRHQRHGLVQTKTTKLWGQSE